MTWHVVCITRTLTIRLFADMVSGVIRRARNGLRVMRAVAVNVGQRMVGL